MGVAVRTEGRYHEEDVGNNFKTLDKSRLNAHRADIMNQDSGNKAGLTCLNIGQKPLKIYREPIS